MTVRVISALPARLPQSDGEWLTIRDSLSRLINASNSCGSFTLTISVATTTVTAFGAGPDSFIVFAPTTLAGAAEIATGAMFISTKAANSFTVTHTNNGVTTRTFDFLIVG